ncbi:unnamed protein product [marine sediment metagenome]|uniref:Uncharacterized protein n=1 Tax=marine sediment metagenome TaxID=412755 RepID=X1ANX3_9ZZZZ
MKEIKGKAKEQFSEGDNIIITVDKGEIINQTKDIRIPIEKIPDFLLKILESGGILNKIKKSK